MNRWKVFFLVLLVLVALAAVYGTAVIRRGFSATDQPSAVETVMARTVRNLGIPRSARNEKNPWTATPDLLAGGAREFHRTTARAATARMATDGRASARISIPRRRICGGPKRKISPTAKFTTSFRTACG